MIDAEYPTPAQAALAPLSSSGGVQYRKKGSLSASPHVSGGNGASSSPRNGQSSSPHHNSNNSGNHHHQHQHHQHHNNHHNSNHHHQSHHGNGASSNNGPLPTFRDASAPPRVQLAGKVEVGADGELVAPDWADDPKRLFISHLPVEYDDFNLQVLFESFGAVESAKISQDKRSVRPKTYGFVQFAVASSAAKAVKELHGTVVAGRSINVAFDATQSVAKHKSELQQQYYLQHQLPVPPHHMPNLGATGYYPMPPNGYIPSKAGRGGRGGGRGRAPRSAMPYPAPPHAYYPPPYVADEIGAPYLYMMDPTSGVPYPYPVYYPPPGMISPYLQEVPLEPYYPSSTSTTTTTTFTGTSAANTANAAMTDSATADAKLTQTGAEETATSSSSSSP